MFGTPVEKLPPSAVRKILILRTAPIPQVLWAVEQLRSAYPAAEFWVLGRQLEHDLFKEMQKMEIVQPWLNPASYRRFRDTVKTADFDLAVMCLNSDSCAGYEAVSSVMKEIPARLKLVAGYTKEWYVWDHHLFQEGHWTIRWALTALEFVLLPLVFLVVRAMPSGNTYMPAGQGRKAPGYDR